MPESKAPVIHWFRRDLRIADNPALHGAAKLGVTVLPVYILSDWRGSHHWTGPNRQHFLCESLASLSKDLRTLGGHLVIRQGDAVKELRKLITETGATALHFNSVPDPFGKSVEQEVRKLCEQLGVACHAHADAALHGPDEILTGSGTPYRVFTPYSRNWLQQEKPTPYSKPKTLHSPPTTTVSSIPKKIPTTDRSSEKIHSLPLPTLATWGLKNPCEQMLKAGESAAHDRLKQTIAQKVQAYSATRDFPAESGTSRISQDLRYGLLSIRTVYNDCLKARNEAPPAGKKSIDVFIKELAWREFYFAILHHFPNVLDEEFNPDWRGLPWDEPGENFEAWKQGTTGFPIVDAGMRELLATGFMHNRVRMITAMFLTKDLHIDWKLGESWFMQHLVDGEIASNNGGWQWSAGTGADAAPYFRIQNPWSQTARYDPDGLYIKKWVPELAKVPPSLFQAPPKDNQPLAPGYPLPCVDHKTERDRTLAIFKSHRAGKK